MKPAFHYIVKAKLIRYTENKEIDFLEFEDKFENENPILARENSFKHYQNYIDVLLEGKGQTYISDRQAREELNTFIDTGATRKITIGATEMEFSDSFGNGIGIFMVIDNPMNDDKIGEEFFIHGIGNISSLRYNTDSIIFELEKELDYYKHFNYETKNKEVQIVYCNSEEWAEGYLGNGEWLESYSEPNTYQILETPFDWTDFGEPYWWGEPDNETEEDKKPVTQTLEDIINRGENNQVEFKPTLLYNFSTHKGGIGIKAIIAKTICAFLNSNGGFLLIGIKDNGEIQGLDYDFKLSKGKNPKDFFRLEFDQMLEHFLSFSVKNNVEGEFYEKDGKDIFIITVRPNKRRPIFLKGQNGKEFYIRGEASSRQLTEIEELVNYCIDRWTT
jgi:Putative DNA-binding domain